MVEKGLNLKHLPKTLLSKSGIVDTTSSLSTTIVGFYFSAHWCGPCRQFTPQLAKVYNEWKKAGKSIEVVFISSDRDQKQFEEYYAEMPWLAVDISEKDCKSELNTLFSVSGIPTLTIVDKSGNVIEADAMNIEGSAVDEWISKAK